MTHLRIFTLTLATLLVLAACGKSDEQVSAVPDTGVNDLLAFVPADTPYVAANLEPIPEDVLDSYLAKAQPVLDSMQEQLSLTRARIESSGNSGTADPAEKLAHALMSELDGKLNRAGMESMGFDLRANQVIYGVGAFPVVRLGLSDSAALRATVLRVLGQADVTAPEQEYQGVSYWKVSDDDTGEVPVGIYISILEDHVAIGILPLVAETDLLPAFLGLQMPAGNDAHARLAELNTTHGYTPYGSGILDTHAFIDALVQPDSLTGRAMASSTHVSGAPLTPECISEIHGIADNAPRMTLGVQDLTEHTVAMQYRVEAPESLAGQLMSLVSEIPMVDALSDKVVAFAFGLKFGPVRDFLIEKATAISNNPYQCEHLAEFNLKATEALTQLNQPMPPFLNNFRGIRVSVTEFIAGRQSLPENARGHLALHVEQPQMLVGMAQMMVPDLSELAITPGDPPVRLPENFVPTPGVTAYAAMSSDAIGIAVGEGEEEKLPGFLEEGNGPEGMFMSASYDMGAYLDYKELFSGQVTKAYNVPEATGPAHDEKAGEIQEVAAKAFRDIADRNTSTLSFTPKGLVIDNRVTFK
jgi:hypothetical protein